jgi:predicted ribosomally synthesized peptide with SipW-like signal peptide
VSTAFKRDAVKAITKFLWHSGKVKAVLAGGLVLGVGASITMAAWNDSEFAQGTFASGKFNMMGSINGTTWAEHASATTAGALPFTVPATNLSPGDVVYAPFAVQLDATTTNNAIATISAASSGTVSNLTYSLITTAAFGCTSTTTGNALVPAGTAVGSVPTSTTIALAKGTSGAAGDPVFLCFAVTAGPLIAQGQSGTSTWQLTAASQ